MKNLRLFLYLIIAGISIHGQAQTLELHPMYHSMGIQIFLPAAYDEDETAICEIIYRKQGESAWKEVFKPDRIRIQGQDQFRGSLFMLDENSTYEFAVTIKDSIPDILVHDLPLQSGHTLAAPVFEPGSNVKWVSPDGTGNMYTESDPGSIKTLLASGAVTCGSTIMLKDGIYTELGLSLTLTSDCNESSPIQFLAAPGANPVFDGGHSAALTWTQHPSDGKLFSAALPVGTEFTNLCLFGGKMLYPYPTLLANVFFGNYNLSELNLGADGFVRDDQYIWIKTQDGTNPNLNTVILSNTFRFLTVYGNDHKSFLKFQGITVKNVARSNVSLANAFTAVAVDLRNVHQVIFDNCNFEYNNSNISFSGPCNDILVQNCVVKNTNGLWSHAMIKKSLVNSVFFPSSLGRAGETGAIEFSSGKNITIRNNRFDGVNSGVVADFNTALMEEVDVYNNVFIDNFDAIESDGNWSNLRVWNNEIIRPMAAFSMAPPLTGPRYFFRNTIHHLQGRRNEADDPYFSGCSPVTSYYSQAVGIKTNSGGTAAGPDASNLYFINNTFHSADTLGFAYTFWDGEWKGIYFKNNIFYSENQSIGYFQGFLNKNNFQLHSAYDNYYRNGASEPLFTIKEIHGQFNCHEVADVDEIESKLGTVTGSALINFEHPLQLNPQFISTDPGGFELMESSPLVDAGKPVSGFYDFNGPAPDVGARETQVASLTQGLHGKKAWTVYPNPAAEVVYLAFGRIMETATIRIWNTSGRLCGQISVRNRNVLGIDLPEAAGLYILSVSADAETQVFRIVKP